MKKAKRGKGDADMRAEYDFSKGERGKHAIDYARMKNLVILAPDVLPYFPDSESVNEALRALVKIARQRRKKTAKKAAG